MTAQVVVDACPEPLIFANYRGKPTAAVVYRPDAWVSTLQDLLADPSARMRLSRTAKMFADRHLTTRAQAIKIRRRAADILRRREPVPMREKHLERQNR